MVGTTVGSLLGARVGVSVGFSVEPQFEVLVLKIVTVNCVKRSPLEIVTVNWLQVQGLQALTSTVAHDARRFSEQIYEPSSKISQYI